MHPLLERARREGERRSGGRERGGDGAKEYVSHCASHFHFRDGLQPPPFPALHSNPIPTLRPLSFSASPSVSPVFAMCAHVGMPPSSNYRVLPTHTLTQPPVRALSLTDIRRASRDEGLKQCLELVSRIRPRTLQGLDGPVVGDNGGSFSSPDAVDHGVRGAGAGDDGVALDSLARRLVRHCVVVPFIMPCGSARKSVPARQGFGVTGML